MYHDVSRDSNVFNYSVVTMGGYPKTALSVHVVGTDTQKSGDL